MIFLTARTRLGKSLLLLSWLLAIVVLVTGASLIALQRYLAAPLPLQQNTLIEVRQGSSLRQTATELNNQGLLPAPLALVLWARYQGLAGSIKTGEYELTPGLTPESLIALLVSGRNKQYPVTFVEGWTMEQVLQALWQSEKITADLHGKTEGEIAAALGDTMPFLEGSIFPDTYYYTKGTTDLAILQRARQRLLGVLTEEWESRPPMLPYASPDEALIMASVIEKESGLNAEKLRIAGVFIRRLRQGMRLQSDPTVIYGVRAGYDGVIRRSDLEADNPWNTYRHAGLPPTPIALAGRASIHASLHPEDAPYLYFVASGDGGHYFSTTLEEHNAAVQRYRTSLQQEAPASASGSSLTTGERDARP